MSLSEKDRAIIEATLPGNTSLTHFTDFRSSHEDLARLLSAVRQEAYKEGWNDREGDLIAGVNRIAPEEASQGAGEPVAWSCTCHPDDNPPVPCPAKYALTDCQASPPNPQARIDALEGENADLKAAIDRLTILRGRESHLEFAGACAEAAAKLNRDLAVEDLSALSRAWGRTADLRDDRDRRINERLKAMLAALSPVQAVKGDEHG